MPDGSTGSVTIGGTVSPAGGNFEEPVTQATLKVVGAFHGLSRERSDARKYPAIDPLISWSKYNSVIDKEKLDFCKSILHHGDEIGSMMKVVGEEGTTLLDYIIDAQENAFLYSGFNKKITAEEVKQHVKNNSICQVLNKEHVKKDDAFFLPAGRVHSIGAGLFLAEIQQTSDATYRLWDYNRKDANGNPRELHLDLALDAIDYKSYSNYKTAYKPCIGRPIKLQECSYFTTNLIEADTFIKFDYKRLDSFVIWICLEGSAIFASSKKHNQKIKQGETILFPACNLPTALIPESEKIKLLEVYVG